MTATTGPTPTGAHRSRAVERAVRRRSLAQLVRESAGFVFVGAVTTGAYLVLLFALEPYLGSYPANILSVLITSVANTAWNRSLSFGVHGNDDVGRHHLQGLFTCLLSMALTSACIALLAAAGTTDTAVRSVVLVVANAGAGILHFLLLKVWVFGR
ncbi:GtrA-like protein [Kineococcus xinjiangensis]|uniref:GtrA-like protein n=1 Tax=Kineococcus xinjiangensis TaxID=512762 RepID=A0A2S6ITJ3_9ACTN|nr:GtrA family protein [Kineococcus xinjiangensis]PPK97500.1 GtrA-like protein [Kineococcus xinjiangensis]